MTKKGITLLTALALGAASAQNVPNAGDVLKNRAEVTFNFTDPITKQETEGTSQSNEVSTTVIGVPRFTLKADEGDKTVPAGQSVAYTYTLQNTGNTILTVNLAESTGTVSTTTVTLAPGVTQQVTVTYSVPGMATGGTQYTHTLTATATTNAGTFIAGNNVQVASNITTVRTPDKITPGGPVDNNGTPTTFPSDPNNGALTPTDPNNPDNGTSTGPGYPNGDTPINVQPGGKQVAYPKADPETENPDKVIFTGTVPNTTGGTADITVGPANDPDGNGPITVQIIDPNTGQPFIDGSTVNIPDGKGGTIPVTVTVHPDGSVTFNQVPPGAIPQYGIVVTYPDTEGTTPPPANIPVEVPIKSGGDTVATPNYTVKTPGVKTQVNDLTIPVRPSITNTTNADLPTTITNRGGYGEVFNLTTPANLTVPAGATIQYVDANGKPLTDTNGDGIVDTGVVPAGEVANIITRVILPASAAAGTNYTAGVTATGAFSGAASTDTGTFNVAINTPDPSNPAGPIDPNTGSLVNFPVTKVAVVTAPDGTARPAGQVAPGDTITYTITGVNRYNTNVYALMLRDPSAAGDSNIFTYADLQSISASSSTGQSVSYSDCAATPAAVADIAAINQADQVCIFFDGNLPTNGTVNATLTFKVVQR